MEVKTNDKDFAKFLMESEFRDDKELSEILAAYRTHWQEYYKREFYDAGYHRKSVDIGKLNEGLAVARDRYKNHIVDMVHMEIDDRTWKNML